VDTHPARGRPAAQATQGTWVEFERQLLGFQPLTSKLRPPTSGVAPVHRRARVALLLDAVEPLALVSAPAGSGKTIVLRQWAAADPRASAWLSCDEPDNDPRVFLTYVVLALQSVIDLDPPILDLLRLGDPPIRPYPASDTGTPLSRRQPRW
jgi:hypothetical protein